MSSGEADAVRRAMKSLDGYHRCAIPGCEWHVSDGERCQNHGGTPIYSYLRDAWGDATSTYSDPSVKAYWREYESEE